MGASKKSEAPLSEEVRPAVLDLVRESPEPVTAKQVMTALKSRFSTNEKQIAPLLAEFAAAGVLHEFAPLKGKALRYWHSDLSVYAPQTLLKTLKTKPSFKLADLKKAVLKSAKGLSDESFHKLFDELRTGGQIWEHPPATKTGRTSLFGAHPPAIGPYLKTITADLNRVFAKLKAAGVPEASLVSAGHELLKSCGLGDVDNSRAVTSVTSGAPAIDLVGLMRQIEPQVDVGALVTLPALRQAASLQKDIFDAAVLDLARSQRLVLHRHDFPASLSAVERDQLVTDGRGTFFIGAALRRTS